MILINSKNGNRNQGGNDFNHITTLSDLNRDYNHIYIKWYENLLKSKMNIICNVFGDILHINETALKYFFVSLIIH